MSHTEQMREALLDDLAKWEAHVRRYDVDGACNPLANTLQQARAALTAPAAEVPEQSTRLRGGVPEAGAGKEPFGWWFTEDPEVFCMPGSGFRRYPDKPQHTVECIALYTAAPQAPALDAVVRDAWRLLNTGDLIEPGDEVLHDDCVTWGPIVGWEVGVIYSTTVFVPMRRKVRAAMSAQAGEGGA